MEPIATYSEVRFDGSRTFTLLPDKILIRGKRTLGSDLEMSIALKTLHPESDKLRARNKGFTSGMWLATFSFVTCSILVSGFHMSALTPPAGGVACICMAGILLMLATYRKVEYVRFKNDGGIAILDIARAGKNAAQLDSFIEALTKQIKVAKGIG
jgi:hypothetical protein